MVSWYQTSQCAESRKWWVDVQVDGWMGGWVELLLQMVLLNGN